ncbi:MAG: hypothetical protein H0V12_07905 [Chloroflexi bacterium]|nr:hypothetical protein [Chloroflexota bacterium]
MSDQYSVSGFGASRSDALHAVGYVVARLRLVEALTAWGWEIVDEVIDEVEFLVARDESGAARIVAVCDPRDTWLAQAILTDAGRYQYDLPVSLVPPVAVASDSALREVTARTDG